jgi:hypothetical protein
MFWIYCEKCGWETPEPNTATPSKCECGATLMIATFTEAEVERLGDQLQKIPIRSIVRIAHAIDPMKIVVIQYRKPDAAHPEGTITVGGTMDPTMCDPRGTAWNRNIATHARCPKCGGTMEPYYQGNVHAADRCKQCGEETETQDG